MNFADFINTLNKRLSEQPLPGHDTIMQKMSPYRLKVKVEPNASTRRSAILMMFYPKGGDIFMPLILRPQYDGVHGGQMAFPGGRVELKDKNIQATALREAQEEIGIKATDVKVIKNLTELFIPPQICSASLWLDLCLISLTFTPTNVKLLEFSRYPSPKFLTHQSYKCVLSKPEV